MNAIMPLRQDKSLFENKMGIEKKFDAFAILDKAGLSSQSSHYTTRSAAYHDLNSKVLAGMYEDIGMVYGKDAAANFTRMIRDLPELRADDFVRGYLILANSDWEWAEEMIYGLPSKPTTREIPELDAEVTAMIKTEFKSRINS